MENERRLEWYDNPNALTNVILVVAIIIIIISQSMAVNSDVSGMVMLRNLFNHNFTYIAAIIYFVLLKTKIGKRNFNIINAIYICLYVLNTVASIFTIFQSFNLSSIISFLLNLLIVCYMSHTFLRDTRIWNDFNLDKLPFDEVKNDWYFNSVCVISLVLLLINLININGINGIITTLFDTVYIILFGRYIYLYKKYNDSKKKLLEDSKDKINEKEETTKKSSKNTKSKNKKDDK